jgi:hypothetical protein
MFQTILVTILDFIGTTIFILCAIIARIAQCLMK